MNSKERNKADSEKKEVLGRKLKVWCRVECWSCSAAKQCGEFVFAPKCECASQRVKRGAAVTAKRE